MNKTLVVIETVLNVALDIVRVWGARPRIGDRVEVTDRGVGRVVGVDGGFVTVLLDGDEIRVVTVCRTDTKKLLDSPFRNPYK